MNTELDIIMEQQEREMFGEPRIVDVTLQDYIQEAIMRANYFIDRGYDAEGNPIYSPDGYMKATIRNARRTYVPHTIEVI